MRNGEESRVVGGNEGGGTSECDEFRTDVGEEEGGRLEAVDLGIGEVVNCRIMEMASARERGVQSKETYGNQRCCK